MGSSGLPLGGTGQKPLAEGCVVRLGCTPAHTAKPLTHSLQRDDLPMTNVIRPTFGRRPDAEPEIVESFSPLQVFGTTVGHFVALIRAETGDEGITLQVIVGRDGGEGAESVAIFPDNAEGEADAEVTAFAILRTLEIVKEAMVNAT